MSEIKPMLIKKFSSQNDLYPASNLLQNIGNSEWLCHHVTDKEAYIEFEFNGFVDISRIEIGNSNSAFVKILVFDENLNNYQPLLFSTPLMSSTDSIKGEGGSKVKSFEEIDLIGQKRCHKWKYLRVVCSQPFNKFLPYGLSFIKFYGSFVNEDSCSEPRPPAIICPKIDVAQLSSADNSEEWQPGSLFSQRKIAGTFMPPSKSTESILNTQTCNPTGCSIKSPGSLSICKEKIRSVPCIDAASTTEVEVIEDCFVRGSDEIGSVEMMDGGEVVDMKPCVSEVKRENVIGGVNDTGDVMKVNASSASHSDGRDEIVKSGDDREILSGVNFVLSGYQNPLRNILRDNGIALGARYRPSWSNGCTHLICAFPNTPKFREVCGKGIIVSDRWLIDCYEQKKHLPWRAYRVRGATSPMREASGVKRCASDVEDDQGSVVTSGKRRRVCDGDQCDTDDEIEMVAAEMGNDEVVPVLPVLPTIFFGMTFFLYGAMDYEERRRLRRILRVFGGAVVEYMSAEVQVVISRSSWDHNFDEALAEYGHLRFVTPEWVDECDHGRCLCPLSAFEMSRQ